MSVNAMALPVISKRVRAFFAPVDRGAGTPAMWDVARGAAFDVDAPTSPWLDLGWVDGFARSDGSKVEALRAGAPASVTMQVRTAVDAQVKLRFASWGKLQMALACGTQQLNMLQEASGAEAAFDGGTAQTARVLLDGSTATVLKMSADDAAALTVGSWLAVDVD